MYGLGKLDWTMALVSGTLAYKKHTKPTLQQKQLLIHSCECTNESTGQRICTESECLLGEYSCLGLIKCLTLEAQCNSLTTQTALWDN